MYFDYDIIIMRRKIETQFREWKDNHSKQCLLVRGARHVGKTFSITRFGMENYDNVVTVNFSLDTRAKTAFDGDLTVDAIIMKLSALYPDKRFEPHRTLVFLDEIQDCPNARASLKAFAMDERYDVIASGSLIGLRRDEIPSYPVGYEHEIYMNPMDFEEFLWALGVDEKVIGYVRERILRREALGEALLQAFIEYMRWYSVVGGMPMAVSRFSTERRMDGVYKAHGDIISDYKDDISIHAKEEERANIDNCFNSISVQLAQANKKFFYTRIEGSGKNDGAKEYAYAINWLENAGIVMPCTNIRAPSQPIEERMIMGQFKLYMRDTGLLMSLYSPELRYDVLTGDMSVNMGAIAENLVATLLAYQGRRLTYFKRDRNEDGGTDRYEIDFVTTVSGKVTALEVKSGDNHTCRSLNKVMKNYGVGGIMLEMRDIFTDDKGVLHLPMFAAAFMDCIDPPREFEPDFSSVDDINSMFGSDSE